MTVSGWTMVRWRFQSPRDLESQTQSAAVCGREPWPLRIALQNLELVAQGEVLEGELPLGAERGGECKQDDFEHRGMLCSASGNRNGDKADGVSGTHSWWSYCKLTHEVSHSR